MWRRLLSLSSLAVVFGIASPAYAQTEVPDAHVTIEEPLELTPDEANKVYDDLKQRMADGYGINEYRSAKDYQSWDIYNSAPYLSATHGNRYINSYANALGADYGKLEPGARYPVGTIFAKDSISAIDENRIFPGAIFFMEKLAAGESTETADWRYVMLLPDGSLYGDSTGEHARNVRYCHTCHVRKADEDYVFFVPEASRR